MLSIDRVRPTSTCPVTLRIDPREGRAVHKYRTDVIHNGSPWSQWIQWPGDTEISELCLEPFGWLGFVPGSDLGGRIRLFHILLDSSDPKIDQLTVNWMIRIIIQDLFKSFASNENISKFKNVWLRMFWVDAHDNDLFFLELFHLKNSPSLHLKCEV